jgi:hypothetical protein
VDEALPATFVYTLDISVDEMRTSPGIREAAEVAGTYLRVKLLVDDRPVDFKTPKPVKSVENVPRIGLHQAGQRRRVQGSSAQEERTKIRVAGFFEAFHVREMNCTHTLRTPQLLQVSRTAGSDQLPFTWKGRQNPRAIETMKCLNKEDKEDCLHVRQPSK